MNFSTLLQLAAGGALAAGALEGCWAVDLEECVTQCVEQCPVGLECHEGWCVLPGSQRSCAEASACVQLEPVQLPDGICTDEPFQLSAHARGGKPPYTWDVAPRRITVSGDASSPDVILVGEFPRVDADRPPFTIQVTGSEGGVCTGDGLSYQLPLFERPSASDNVLPAACVGRAYGFALAGSGGDPASYVWQVSGLPAGLTADAAGAIEGVVASPGDYLVSIDVRDAHCAALATTSLALTVVAAADCVTIQPDLLLRPCVGVAYDARLSATGGQPRESEPRYDWAVLEKPDWLDFDTETQRVSALAESVSVPTSDAPESLEVRVTDAIGETETRTFDVTPRTDCAQ